MEFFDLAARRAQQREAKGKPVKVKLDETNEIFIPPVAAWRQSAQKHLADGKVWAFFAGILSEEDLEKFDEADLMNEEVEELLEFITEQQGLDQGKSGKSSKS